MKRILSQFSSIPSKLLAPASRDRVLAASLFLIFVVTGYSQMVPGVCGVYHDDGAYVSTAKALAEGRGYRLINLPNAPNQTKYPILFPAFLSVIWKIQPDFPSNVIIMQFFTLINGALAAGLCYLYMVRFVNLPRMIAFLLLLLCVTSRTLLFHATIVLSEMTFFLLTILMLWFFENRIKTTASSPAGDFFTGVLIALPFLCRVNGAAFIPIALILWYRRRLPLRWCSAGALAMALPWLVWVALASRTGGDATITYYTDYIGWWIEYGLSDLAHVATSNFFLVPISFFSMTLEGFFVVAWNDFPPFLLFVLSILFWFALIVGGRRDDSLKYFLLGYLILVCLWPWPPARFLVPLLPLLAGYLLRTILLRTQSIPRSPKFYLVSCPVMIMLVVLNTWILYSQMGLNRSTGYPQSYNPEPKELSVYWASYEQLFDWLTRHSRPDEIIACGLDTMFYLYTGRQAVRTFTANPIGLFYKKEEVPSVGTTGELKNLLERYKPRYLLHTPMNGFMEKEPFEQLIQDFQEQYPNVLSPAFTGDDPRFVILEVR